MTSNETKEMFKLGEVVFLEGVKKLKEYKELHEDFIYKRSELIIKKRLAVVELTHGLELILKAVLKKNGYSINKIKQGIYLEETRIKDVENPELTIELAQVIRYFKKKYRDIPFDKLDKIRELRNQIIHRGTRIGQKKREYFIGAIDCLISLYKKENINHRKFLREIEVAKELI